MPSAALKPSAFEAEEERPRYWDKRVSAAYLLLTGDTQKQAAEKVGRSDRTLREWISDAEWWAIAEDEARSRWLTAAADAARRAVLRSLNAGNAELGKWVLERMEPALAPPVQRMKSDGRLEHDHRHHIVELPAETDGQDSLEAEEVLRGGRDVSPAALQLAAGGAEVESAHVLEEAAAEYERTHQPSTAGALLLEKLKRRVVRRRGQERPAVIDLPDEED